MRPDEHKKKRSAQYQKKHGGATAKGKNDNEKNSVKSEKSGSAKADRTLQTSRSSTTDKKVDPRQNSASSESEEDEQSTGAGRRTFRRREISSNWAKYDLPPVEAGEATEPKGQDFNKLLLSAGSAVAHFRFKDEENWEEEGGNGATADAQVLSLDCAELATSLNCLPLYTQLRLDRDIFMPDEVSAMDKTANQNRALAGLPALDEKKEPSTAQTESSTRKSTSSAGPAGDLNPGSTPASPLSAKQPKKSAVEKNIENNTKDTAGSLPKDTVVREDRTADVGFTDADLDSLLESSDLDHKSVGDGGAAGSEKQSEASGEVTEQDLDDLLSMESPQSSKPGTASESKQKVNGSSTAAESAELEDWLDSVLDD